MALEKNIPVLPMQLHINVYSNDLVYKDPYAIYVAHVPIFPRKIKFQYIGIQSYFSMTSKLKYSKNEVEM